MSEETQETTEVAEPTPPIETTDNQAEVERLKSENLKLQQTVTRHANRENELRKSNTEFSNRLDTSEETQAQILDLLDEIRGDTTETPSKTSRVEALRKSRETQPQPQAPTEVAKFLSYLDTEGLNMKDAIVMESVQGRDPDEALTYLRNKIKEDTDSKVLKLAEERAKVIAQQTLKEMGVTKPERGPNTGGSKRITSEQLKKMSASEFKEKLGRGEISV